MYTNKLFPLPKKKFPKNVCLSMTYILSIRLGLKVVMKISADFRNYIFFIFFYSFRNKIIKLKTTVQFRMDCGQCRRNYYCFIDTFTALFNDKKKNLIDYYDIVNLYCTFL